MVPEQKIRALVVDDSIFMRTILKGALSSTTNIEVIGTAQNGNEALEKIEKLKPDVVTLDIEMPGLTGLEVLERVMKKKPLPIVMVSTKTQKGAEMTFQALELGAIDYVAKPLADKSASLAGFRQKVVAAVEAAFASNRARLGAASTTRIMRPCVKDIRTDTVVAIGISAGGPATLHKLIPTLPKHFPPIVLTQHMPADFTGPFAQRLSDESELEVREAKKGDQLKPGLLLLAPGSAHMTVLKQGSRYVIQLDDGPKVSGFRPSVDVLFNSVAEAFKDNAIGLIMTGMGCDGSDGIKSLRKVGAQTLAQDQESSVVYGMPKAAAATGCIDRIVSLAEIPDAIAKCLAPVKT
jgi:two-component system, chemotaxis family, protein-glutamate methylesterase/glutaminase